MLDEEQGRRGRRGSHLCAEVIKAGGLKATSMLSASNRPPRDSCTCWLPLLYPCAASCLTVPLPRGDIEPTAPEGLLSQEGNPPLFIQAAQGGQQLLVCCGGGEEARGKDGQL